MRLTAAVLLPALTIIPANAQERAGGGVNLFSLEREAALGRQIAAELALTLPIVHDPALDQYLAEVTAELKRAADPRFAYAFTWYDDARPAPPQRVWLSIPADLPSPEPIAIAGGPIFVPLSLLANAAEEAQFPAQLAHAMAHVALRHATRYETRVALTDFGTQFIPSGEGLTRVAMEEGRRLAGQLAGRAFLKQAEAAAGNLGASIAAAYTSGNSARFEAMKVRAAAVR